MIKEPDPNKEYCCDGFGMGVRTNNNNDNLETGRYFLTSVKEYANGNIERGYSMIRFLPMFTIQDKPMFMISYYPIHYCPECGARLE